MPSDIEIAQQAKTMQITDIAQEKLGISEEFLELVGYRQQPKLTEKP